MAGKKSFNFGYFISKPRNVIIAAVLLFLPLLFLGTRASHDWGDDFAQYIHQAGNIVNGIPQSETGYIYNPLNPGIGPQAYPMGFPLLLAPVYALAGNKITAFIMFNSLIYIVLGFLFIIFYRQYFSLFTSLVLAVIFLYNPQMIIFKREVMSDIPFTAFLIINFILYRRMKPGNIKQFMVLSFLTGYMLTIRPAGVIFVAAVVMEQFVFLFRKKIQAKDFTFHTLFIVLIPVLIYFIINSVLFAQSSGGSLSDYLQYYYQGDFFRAITENLARYIEVFRYLYVPEAGVFKGISLLLGSVMVAMTLLGFAKRLLQGPQVYEWFFIFYTFMLIGYHDNDSAFRLMVPLGFLFLFYATTGLKTVQLLQGFQSYVKAGLTGVLILSLFMPGLVSIAHSGYKTLEGPQQKSSIEAFNYISKNIVPESVVVFAKPRALALYGSCRSMADPFTNDPTLIHRQVTEAKASYLLIHNKLTGEPMKRYSRVMQPRLTKLWENKEFVLYRINPVNPSTHR